MKDRQPHYSKEEYENSFGQRVVRPYRKAHMLTQKKLGGLVGRTTNPERYIRHIEHGDTNPSLSELNELAHVLGFTVADEKSIPRLLHSVEPGTLGALLQQTRIERGYTRKGLAQELIDTYHYHVPLQVMEARVGVYERNICIPRRQIKRNLYCILNIPWE